MIFSWVNTFHHLCMALFVLSVVSTCESSDSHEESETTQNNNSSVPFGEVIRDCKVSGTIALAFDDGPYIYTWDLLDILKQNNNTKATFFFNGHNFGDIEDYGDVVRRAYREGHQIASHTWSHKILPRLNKEEITYQMHHLDDAIAEIMYDFCPTYVRVPFFYYGAHVLPTMKELGYHVIDASIDIGDFEHGDAEKSLEQFKEKVQSGGTITLAHDALASTVHWLVPRMLEVIRENNLTPVSVGECLGDPKVNWYRTISSIPSEERSSILHHEAKFLHSSHGVFTGDL